MFRTPSAGSSRERRRSLSTPSSPSTARRSAADRRTNTNEREDDMALEIFWGSGSPFSWRVLLGAEIKGLTYESRLLEFSKGHMKTLDFLQMNPRARVPVIRDAGFVVYEALA